MIEPFKRYIGDSVYLQWNGVIFILTTENGLPEPSNLIYLEPEIMQALTNAYKPFTEEQQ